MKQDEIIEMARQASLSVQVPDLLIPVFERFAKLVAAKVEEALAEEYMTDIHRAIKIEREACAQVCEQQEEYGPLCETIWDCAEAIRARGKA